MWYALLLFSIWCLMVTVKVREDEHRKSYKMLGALIKELSTE